jgi:phage-related protein
MDKENDVRKILIYGDDFWRFYHKQSTKIKERINWTIKLVQVIDRIPEKYLKHIIGTSLYELRIISGSNIYRIFCFFDKGKLIVVLNGFQKKTQKAPKREIDRALKLQKKYYDEQKE